MQRLLALALLLISVTGCSTHQVYQSEQQYCYTEETIVNIDGKASTKTVVECSDKPKVHHLNRDIGVAGMCSSYNKQVVRPNGQTMNIKGVMCRDKLTGKWVPADPNLSY